MLSFLIMSQSFSPFWYTQETWTMPYQLMVYNRHNSPNLMLLKFIHRRDKIIFIMVVCWLWIIWPSSYGKILLLHWSLMWNFAFLSLYCESNSPFKSSFFLRDVIETLKKIVRKLCYTQMVKPTIKPHNSTFHNCMETL